MPRFSIVITTTDRPTLLRDAVRNVLATNFDDYEVIVSDNFSKRPAFELLKSFKSPRLRIIRTERRLPAPDHWEFAWNHIAGSYVMYLGDDNALHPDILRVADRAIQTYGLELMSWRVCSYLHPDWNITYGTLPNRGNILGLQVGTTGDLYRCDQEVVLKLYCDRLRIVACFPCMPNLLFRKARGDQVRRTMGQLFWSPYPDISSSVMVLGAIPPGSYGFLDGWGSLGGWSRDSNLATALSGGRASQKILDYYKEFGDRDLYPHHQPKFITVANGLAAPISQGRALMPECFSRYSFDHKTLALRSLDDMYVHRTSIWLDDQNFIDAFERFLESLPAPDAAAARSYRDERLAEQAAATMDGTAPAPIRNRDEARAALLANWRAIDADTWWFAWRLLRATLRDPLGRYWSTGDTTYIDMRLFSCSNVADAAHKLSRVLQLFDKRDDGFVRGQQAAGVLGDRMAPGTALGWLGPREADPTIEQKR
jgi:glycosyltransferase involved in cell wall biosynthesis